jgi:hypothetical protein
MKKEALVDSQKIQIEQSSIANFQDLLSGLQSRFNLSDDELIEKTGLLPEYFQNIVTGQRSPTREVVVALIHAIEGVAVGEESDLFPFEIAEKEQLLNSAGYGLVGGMIDSSDIEVSSTPFFRQRV